MYLFNEVVDINNVVHSNLIVLLIFPKHVGTVSRAVICRRKKTIFAVE